jgi:lysophospholipase L1-like esterase
MRMLALGDSVMWGQGLLDKNKFTYRLRDWLCERRGNAGCQDEQDVELHVEAHSGAIISKPNKKSEKKTEDNFVRADSPYKYAGEVNHAYPTLWGQLDLARRYYGNHSGEVDLVLVNGGINDVNATKILVRGLFGSNLTKLSKKYCGEEMKRLLVEVADTFPNARIVVPGYFPLVSEGTPPHILFETIWEWLFRGEEAEAEVFAAFQEDWRALPGESSEATKARTTRTIKRLAERSKEFVKASNDALEDAVDHLNKERPLPGGVSARGLFVPVAFGDDNGYAALRSYLWRLGRKDPTLVLNCADDNIVTRFVVNDEMQRDRPCMCSRARELDYPRAKYLICFRAGAFHPNRDGAVAYFEAIKAKLETVIASTDWVAKD